MTAAVALAIAASTLGGPSEPALAEFLDRALQILGR